MVEVEEPGTGCKRFGEDRERPSDLLTALLDGPLGCLMVFLDVETFERADGFLDAMATWVGGRRQLLLQRAGAEVAGGSSTSVSASDISTSPALVWLPKLIMDWLEETIWMSFKDGWYSGFLRVSSVTAASMAEVSVVWILMMDLL